jgi:hypothetical protein
MMKLDLHGRRGLDHPCLDQLQVPSDFQGVQIAIELHWIGEGGLLLLQSFAIPLGRSQSEYNKSV